MIDLELETEEIHKLYEKIDTKSKTVKVDRDILFKLLCDYSELRGNLDCIVRKESKPEPKKKIKIKVKK